MNQILCKFSFLYIHKKHQYFRIPLRIQVSSKENFQQFVYRVAKLWNHCSKHNTFSFQNILGLFALSSDTCVNIFYNFQTTENDRNLNSISNFDLSLIVKHDQHSNQILLTFIGSTEFLHETTIDIIAERFHTLCQQLFCPSFIIQNQPMYELSILLPSEHKMLEKLNNNINPTKIKTCIHQAFIEQAILYPNKVAVILDNQCLTYSELLFQTQQLSWILVNEKGVKPGDIICQNIDRSIEMIIGMMSILMAGAIYTPLNTSDPSERLQTLIEQVNPKLILVHTKSRTNMNSQSVTIIDVCEIIQLNALVNAQIAIGLSSQDNITPESLAYIVFTSGSTGVPKGAQIRHRNFMSNMKAYTRQTSDIMLQFATCSFDIHLEEIFGSLVRGAQLIMLKPNGHLDFDYITCTIYDKKVNFMETVPSWLNALGKYLLENVHTQQRIKSLQRFCVGGRT